MRGSLVRARRPSISSACLQWACMSIMAVLLSLSSNGLTPIVQGVCDVVCQLSRNLFQPPQRSKLFPSSRFFVPGSVQLGLHAFGVFLVIVLCVGRVLAVAASREVAVGRRARRAGTRIAQPRAYEGLRAVIERLLDRDPHDDAGQLAPHLEPL